MSLSDRLLRNKLMESGTILYLKEHTEETRKLRKTIITIAVIIFILLLLGIVYIKHNNIIAYPVQQLREIASKCETLK